MDTDQLFNNEQSIDLNIKKQQCNDKGKNVLDSDISLIGEPPIAPNLMWLRNWMGNLLLLGNMMAKLIAKWQMVIRKQQRQEI